MHVTSNPYFAFHDDVFPGFVKNAAAQQRFPSSPTRNTIIPAKFFSSLGELNHISTIEMKLNGRERLEFKIRFTDSSSIFAETKILELIGLRHK